MLHHPNHPNRQIKPCSKCGEQFRAKSIHKEWCRDCAAKESTIQEALDYANDLYRQTNGFESLFLWV